MNILKVKEFIESSFLGPLLKDEKITDISFNGKEIYYLHNDLGRRKSEIIISKEESMDFIRQIANMSEKQFSVLEPCLNVSIQNYRVHALHSSICRVDNEKCITFDIRISHLNRNLSEDFMDKDAKEILINALNNKKSVIISGPTGAGKTELQKFLIQSMKPNTRVIVIDNVQELEMIKSENDIDLTSWVYDEFTSLIKVPDLIRNALRSNPDWLIIAEARGAEFSNILDSAMTGHPIITTIHSYSLETSPKRAARMVLMGRSELKMNDVLSDIYEHFGLYVFVNRKERSDGSIWRYIESIGEIKNEKMHTLYKMKEEAQ